MQQARNSELLPLDSELEQTLSFFRRKQRATARSMAEKQNELVPQWTLRDYFKPMVNENYSGIQR